MAQTIDELTANYTNEEGQELCKELKKEVLSRGGWTTIMFMYQEWNKKTEEWGAPKARIERFQKRNGEFRSQSRFNFSSAKQARQIIDVLDDWFPEES
ncbi:MAG: hypothetical protein WC966_08905 [Bradymonadales bacterium]|jgi:hypothetical protein